MPKVINDVSRIIKNCAMDLFVKYGYLSVDMKMISDKSGIAVGTIYHYYKNKKQLYLCVLNESWEITFSKLNEINALACTSEEKLYRLITTLYYDIKDRNGLGKVLFDNSVEELKKGDYLTELKNKLLEKVITIISSFKKEEIEISPIKSTIRLAETLLISINAMVELHSDDDIENTDFLKHLFSLVI